MVTYWIGMIAYTLQIYFDFSGYSDMAIGLGRMFGFEFMENFNYPYISRTITEFWRRWHISLSTWFREYLYFPLGGNRVKVPRHMLNLMIVWSLTGLWHGASWNFVMWGTYYGVLLILEKYIYGRYLEKAPPWAQHVYAMLIVMIGWVFFFSSSLTAANHYLGVILEPALFRLPT
jgi:alginate O-acetyltransferase complex protein AlgI